MHFWLLQWNVHATVLAAILYLLPIADHLQSSSEQWSPVPNPRPVSSPSYGLWPDWWPVQPSQKEEDRKSSQGTEGQHFSLFNLFQPSSNVWFIYWFLVSPSEFTRFLGKWSRSSSSPQLEFNPTEGFRLVDSIFMVVSTSVNCWILMIYVH